MISKLIIFYLAGIGLAFANTWDEVWPGGAWGLPMPVTGCPPNHNWKHGWLYQDSEDSSNGNSWSEPNHFPSTGRNYKSEFCMQTHGGNGEWPVGDYCIYAKNGCPCGFSCGYLRWDDEDSSNSNSQNGTLPDGSYTSDTTIHFACRNDGDAGDEIVLPTTYPFYLFRYNNACQTVRGTVVTEEWLYWDNEDSSNIDVESPPHPFEDGGSSNHKLHYCYYEPLTNQHT